MPKLYTVADLSTLFSRTIKTIRLWIAEGIFPRAFKVKDGWYVQEGDVKKVMLTRNYDAISGLIDEKRQENPRKVRIPRP